MSVRLDRVVTQTAAITFDRLNPLGKQAKSNKDALALIVGVADYENTSSKQSLQIVMPLRSGVCVREARHS